MKFKKPLLMLGGVVVLVAAALPSYYFYDKYQKSQQLLKNPTQAAANELKEIETKVGKLITLPDAETPTLATVSDKEKLKDQPLFAKAENGDKVLIYNNAKRAYLYRPSLNKIVEVASANISTGANAPDVAGARTAPLSVAILNGTSAVGLTKSAEKKIKEGDSTINVVIKDNAGKQDYEKTLVIDLSGKEKESADKIAGILGGSVAELPSGEKKPDADILIIIGKDYIGK